MKPHLFFQYHSYAKIVTIQYLICGLDYLATLTRKYLHASLNAKRRPVKRDKFAKIDRIIGDADAAAGRADNHKLHDLAKTLARHVPKAVQCVRREEGSLYSTFEEFNGRWIRHF